MLLQRSETEIKALDIWKLDIEELDSEGVWYGVEQDKWCSLSTLKLASLLFQQDVLTPLLVQYCSPNSYLFLKRYI